MRAAPSRVKRVCAAAATLAVLAGVGHASLAGQGSPTLADVLRQHGATGDSLARAVLDRPAWGYAVHRDDQVVVVAYFRGDGRLHVARVARAAAPARDASVSVDDAVGPGHSISDIQRHGPFIYLSTHLTPSAGRLIILSDADLTVRRVLNGWTLSVLPNGSVVVHESQTHFAPTHVLEVSVFDPTTLAAARIYPPSSAQSVRRRFIERVAEAYRTRGTAWFAEYNHHGDPTRFDSALMGAVTVDTAAGTLSFEVRFGDPENRRDPLPFSQRVSVTCAPIARVEALQCREQPGEVEGPR